ncbi:MAG: 2-polyprenyl-3-methyl-6-methoxy-1,4-benzoquinone monooxygenase [Xanthomonadales bacterium]|nr:2-polyprenyl-3-methyl-6-methoxy-1,4-benzoquinone monooxygenase [Xanthomonadales bacterium]
MSTLRTLSALDRLIADLDHALLTATARQTPAARPNPAGDAESVELDATQRRHVAGLMRINHSGEVCAQALYLGQARVARDEATREHLLRAAQEEADHLAWCAQRLTELDFRPSLLNPLWYAGSYAIGMAAGLAGDGYNLGFVVETERQVEAHLEDHLRQLPEGDERSRRILQRMAEEEAEHADQANAAGARALPTPIPTVMWLVSQVMKLGAYRL